MTDERLHSDDAADRAIDGAVREIMSAEPAFGFRYRVMRRLANPAPARWTWLQRGTAAAALAMLLALAILMRPSLHRVEPAKIASAPESQVSISTPAAGASSPSTATQRRSPPPSVRPLRTTGPSAAPADRPVHAASLPVTEAADPVSDAGGHERREEGSGESGEDVMHVEMAGLPDQLAVPAIAQPASAISAIVIAPIAITDIAVAPIPAGGR